MSSVFMEKWILTKNMPLPHFYLDPSSEVYQMRQNPKNCKYLTLGSQPTFLLILHNPYRTVSKYIHPDAAVSLMLPINEPGVI